MCITKIPYIDCPLWLNCLLQIYDWTTAIDAGLWDCNCAIYAVITGHWCHLRCQGHSSSMKFRINRSLSIKQLTHWGRVTHICVGKTTIIGSDNGLSPCRRQAIIWTNSGTLLMGTLRTIFSEILIECHTFFFKKMHMKMSSGKWRLSCLGLNVLIPYWYWSYVARGQ